jgi:hypothetical protein
VITELLPQFFLTPLFKGCPPLCHKVSGKFYPWITDLLLARENQKKFLLSEAQKPVL